MDWISVEDRLPSDKLDGVAVIVAVPDHLGGRIAETDAWHKHIAGGRFAFWGEKVTHWQPLPTPPQ